MEGCIYLIRLDPEARRGESKDTEGEDSESFAVGLNDSFIYIN